MFFLVLIIHIMYDMNSRRWMLVAKDKKLVELPRDLHTYETSGGDRPFDRWLKKQKGSRNTAVNAALEQIIRGRAVKVKAYPGNIGAIVLVWPTKL